MYMYVKLTHCNILALIQLVPDARQNETLISDADFDSVSSCRFLAMNKYIKYMFMYINVYIYVYLYMYETLQRLRGVTRKAAPRIKNTFKLALQGYL